MGRHAGFDGVHKPDAKTTDATPQFYYNQPGYQDLQGQPAPVAQGTSVGPMAPGAPLYCPPNQDGALCLQNWTHNRWCSIFQCMIQETSSAVASNAS